MLGPVREWWFGLVLGVSALLHAWEDGKSWLWKPSPATDFILSAQVAKQTVNEHESSR